MKKFTLLMGAALLGLTASAQLYVTGNDVEGENGSWNPASAITVNAVDGYYTFKATGEFKMSTVQSTSWGAFEGGCYRIKGGNWTKGNGTASASLEKGNSNVTTPVAETLVTYKVNTELTTITATWDAGTVVDLEWGLIGTGVIDWNTDSMMEKTGDDTYTWTGNINGEFKFRANKKWGTELTYDGTIAANGTYNVSSGSANIKMYAENVTLTLHPDAGTLVVTGISAGGEVVLPEHFYILGYVNGAGWAPNNAVEMTKTDNGFEAEFTIGNAGDGNGFFSFTEQTADKWDDLGQRWGATANDYVLKDGAKATIVQGENAFKVTADSTLHISLNWETKEFTVDVSSAVATIEAANGEAVYFNMQGVRVANPENGLFIRVQNGKAVKVVK